MLRSSTLARGRPNNLTLTSTFSGEDQLCEHPEEHAGPLAVGAQDREGIDVSLTTGKNILPGDAMPGSSNSRDAVIAAIKAVRPDIDVSSLTDDTKLIRGLGCASVDGVDLACELEVVLGVIVPDDQNPLVRDEGGWKRDRTLAELVTWTGTLGRQAETEKAIK